MQLTEKIWHGAAYYPELWDQKTILRDIAIMKDLGINVVRMGEFSWSLLEPRQDEFNIGLFDDVIDLLAKSGIATIMCTPTATPPRWFTAAYPDSLYVDRNMVRAHHGSREHVCFNSPDYIARTKIIVEKLGEHYGKNPNIIAWQLHNEYNCPPVNECVCDNCKRAWQTWLREKYGDVEVMDEKWNAGVWSTRYNSFEDVLPPRPTPNGHSASMTTNYTRFTFDSVAKYNAMQAEILKKYVSAPLTHNTNRTFHIDQESIFRPLDFVSFDDYSEQFEYEEALFAAEMCRCLKAGAPFWEMETASSYSANLHGRKGYHARGYVRAQAVAGFFAGSVGFSYWLFRQHRGGTEMPHAHLVTSWGAYSASCANVRDVSEAIEVLEPFLHATRPARAPVALLYSDKSRAFCMSETLSSIQYTADILACYKSILKSSVYRDIVYESGDLTGYKVIFVPYVMHISPALLEKLASAAKEGATVVIGPYSGWRTDDHTYFTDHAFGETEALFGTEVKDVAHFFGQHAAYEAFGQLDELETIGAVVEKGVGVIRGGYYDGMSLIAENRVGKGKVVFLGAKLPSGQMDAFAEKYIAESVRRPVVCEEGIALYVRDGDGKQYYCMVNMTAEPKKVRADAEYTDILTGERAREKTLAPCEYLIWRK